MFFTVLCRMGIVQLLQEFRSGNIRALARCISIVENESDGYETLMKQLKPAQQIPVVGFTGAPGAGKSSLVNALVHTLVKQQKRVAIIAVDPTSPFNYGSLLGDRIRMADHFTNDHVYIRSMATRGSLGGLCGKIVEVVHVMQCFGFDSIIIETVGVGQSEVEIAGVADTTVVVMVPEAGDEVQTLKSGVMEIADIFVVNKSDREGAEKMALNLQKLVHGKPGQSWTIPVINTVATQQKGLDELVRAIEQHARVTHDHHHKSHLLAEKALLLIQQHYVKHLHKSEMEKEILELLNKQSFHLFDYVQSKIK